MAPRAIGLMLVVAACGSADGASGGITVRDSAGVQIVEHELAALDAVCRVDSVPSVRIGVAEGPEEYMFYRLFGATQLSDGRIVIVNQGSQEIRYYAPDGTFLQRAGRGGEGPAEFSNAFYIWQTRGDTVYVGDYRPWQFEVFSPEGEWIRGVRPEPPYANLPGVISVLADGRLVLAKDESWKFGAPGFVPDSLTVVVHSADGTRSDSLVRLENGHWGRPGGSNSVRSYRFFESFAQVSARGSTIALGHGSRPELRLYGASEAPALQSIVRWSVPDRAVTPSDVDAERDRINDEYGNPDLVDAAQPVADSFPAFSWVEMGRDGRIWVREYRRPTEPSGQRWIGFDGSGRFACTATMPSDDVVLEFGADYVLMKDPDADGVERVSRFRLGAPGGM
ncbi:MAG TPA: hypothetical protein VFS94_12730 [Gemmatimonadales bacterium]|nr:hypothetical protein [Gemmatimonadales bacterium]